jgi:transposase InsO family protein
VQQTCFAPEIKDLNSHQEVAANSTLKSLHPFIDQQGLLRVGGCLQKSLLPYQARHQLILPSSHHFTKLVVLAEHMRLLHAGPQLLIASLRETYWIPRIKNIVRNVIHHFLPCYKLKVQTSQQLMGQLPPTRVQPARPFLTTGVDYAGPVHLRLGLPRSKTIIKGYVAIFVCFATKAIHIEVVSDMTTESFLAALRRFIARRGKPRTIYSDNGTNFQGAANQLHAIYKMLQSKVQMTTIQDFLTSEGCDWFFIPPNSPHFGGLWEAAVKSMKYHMKRVLGLHVATFEELATLMTQIEACLNSRPLFTVSDDPFNASYLSPGHFLIGQPLTQLPMNDFTDVHPSRLSRWQTQQRQLQQFWQSWSKDYLQELPQRSR